MRKDPSKLCSYCYRLKSYSYIMNDLDDYIMTVNCAEFPRHRYINARDMDMKCIGYIPIEAVSMPKMDPFIEENEMTL